MTIKNSIVVSTPKKSIRNSLAKITKITKKSQFLIGVKKNDVSFVSLIPFLKTANSLISDAKIALHKGANGYHEFKLEKHNFTRLLKNELSVSNFFFHKFFNAKKSVDVVYWSSINVGVNALRTLIYPPVKIIDHVVNHYDDLKLNLIRGKHLGTFFILLYWILSRPLFKPLFLLVVKIIRLLSFILMLNFLRYLIKKLATDNFLSRPLSAIELRNSFYKLVNFSIFSIHKMPLLKERSLSKKGRLLHMLKRPNSRILGFFTPVKTFAVVVAILGLFTLLYTTVIL